MEMSLTRLNKRNLLGETHLILPLANSNTIYAVLQCPQAITFHRIIFLTKLNSCIY